MAKQERKTVSEAIDYAIDTLMSVSYCKADTLRLSKKNLIFTVIHELQQVQQTARKAENK